MRCDKKILRNANIGRNLEMTNNELKFPLKERKCAPCEGGIPPLRGRVLSEFLANLSIDWSLTHDDRLRKICKFKDFKKRHGVR